MNESKRTALLKLEDELEDDDGFILYDGVRSQAKRKRQITYENARVVIESLNTKAFKKFTAFIDEIEKLLSEDKPADALNQGNTEAQPDAFVSLNMRMKAKDSHLYRTLMVRIYDSTPKKSEYQSVSIDKNLIEQLKKIRKTDNPVIKDLVNWALERFVVSEKSRTTKAIPKMKTTAGKKK